MKKIVLMLIFALTAFNALAQVKITGVVKDSKGEPVIGAAVMLDGSANIGTVTYAV